VHFFLSGFLLYHGLDPAGIELRFMKAEELAGALISEEADAISMRDPILEDARRGIGRGKWIEMSVPGLYTKTYNLVGRAEFPKKYPGMVEKILKVLIEASEYIEQRPRQARKLMASRLGLSRQQLERLWPSLQFRVSLSQGLLVTLKEEAAWAATSGGLEKAPPGNMPDFLSLLDIGPLSRVAPDAVGLIGLEPEK